MVKGQGPTKVIMVCDTPPYGHAPTYQISLTYLKRQKCYDPDKKILFKKQLFHLEVKGQGPMKVITVCDTPPYGHAIHIPNKYYLKNNYLTLRSKVMVPRRSLRYVTHHLMVMHPHTKYHWPISKEKNVMTRTRKYYLKNIIWPWGQRSRSMKVITVCDTPSYCQTKTICPPLFEGET